MTSKHVSVLLLLAFFAVSPTAYADARDEATIIVVDEGDTPDDVVKVIELPDRAAHNTASKPASDPAAQNAASKPASDPETGNNSKDKAGESTHDSGPEVSTHDSGPEVSGHDSGPEISGHDSGSDVSEEARDKDLKDQAKKDAKQAGKSDARKDNPGKGHGSH